MTRFGVVTLLLVGCTGPSQIVIKNQIASKCTADELRDCPRIVSGAMAYMNGAAVEGRTELTIAATENPVERVKRFTGTLLTMADMTEGDTSISLRDIASILVSADRPPPPPPAPPPAPPPIVADDHLRSGMATPMSDDKARPCDPRLTPSDMRACRAMRVITGPFVITSLYASGGCPDELFVTAMAEGAPPKWSLLAIANGQIAFTGKLLVDRPSSLWIGTRGVMLNGKDDMKCSVVWSGYHPISLIGSDVYGTFEGPGSAPVQSPSAPPRACDPPYNVDPRNGVKHYKAECL